MECFDENKGDTKQRFYRGWSWLHCVLLWLRMVWMLKVWKQNTMDFKHLRCATCFEKVAKFSIKLIFSYNFQNG